MNYRCSVHGDQLRADGTWPDAANVSFDLSMHSSPTSSSPSSSSPTVQPSQSPSTPACRQPHSLSLPQLAPPRPSAGECCSFESAVKCTASSTFHLWRCQLFQPLRPPSGTHHSIGFAQPPCPRRCCCLTSDASCAQYTAISDFNGSQLRSCSIDLREQHSLNSTQVHGLIDGSRLDLLV